jgi:hypothetical protein
MFESHLSRSQYTAGCDRLHRMHVLLTKHMFGPTVFPLSGHISLGLGLLALVGFITGHLYNLTN